MDSRIHPLSVFPHFSHGLAEWGGREGRVCPIKVIFDRPYQFYLYKNPFWEWTYFVKAGTGFFLCLLMQAKVHSEKKPPRVFL